MKRIRIHDFSHTVDTLPAAVAVVIVNHRPPGDTRLADALQSLALQSYPNVFAIVVDNYEQPGATIGSARNQAVKSTDAPLITFLGEQDQLTADAIASMVSMHNAAKLASPSFIHCAIGLTLYGENMAPQINMGQSPGLFDREFLLTQHFIEADHRVDQLMLQHMQHLSALDGNPRTWRASHHFGYMLRIEPFRRDGIALQ